MNRDARKRWFSAIKSDEAVAVGEVLDSPSGASLLNAPCSVGSKSDHGLSPLQIAIRAAAWSVIQELLARGAHVDFSPAAAPGAWTTPVLHDAVTMAVMCAVGSDKAQVCKGEHLLQDLLERGANANIVDSVGNATLSRLAIDARQHASMSKEFPQRMPPRLWEPFRRFAVMLIKQGADPDLVVDERGSVRDQFHGEPCIHALFDSPST